MRTRSLSSAALLLTLVLLGAAGCTGGDPPAPLADQNEHPTVTVLTGVDSSAGSGQSAGVVQELADWWNSHRDQHDDITIKLEPVVGGADAVHAEMLAAAQTHDPSYDVFNVDTQWTDEFAAGGYLLDLTGRGVADTAQLLPAPLAAATVHGRLLAVPFTADAPLLYYRTDLVSAEQVSRVHSFADLQALASSVLARQPAGVTEGYAGQFASYEGLTVNSLEAVWSHDPKAFTADGRVADPGAVRAGLADLSALFRSGAATAAERGYQENESLAAFESGRAALMRNWPIAYAQLATHPRQPDDVADVAAHFAVAPLPFAGVLGGQSLAVSSASRNPAAALKVVAYLTGRDSELCLMNVGGFPATRADAYTPRPELPGDGRCGRQAGRPAPASVVRAAVAAAKPRPQTRYYTEWSDLLQRRVAGLLALHSPPGDADLSLLTTQLAAAAAGRAPR